MPADNQSRLPRLTSLCAFAAAVVFLFHAQLHVGWRPASPFSQGYVGVGFFFVLSGTVLAWSTSSETLAPLFWRRRFARLWPSHAVMACVAAVVPGVAAVGTGGVLVNLALLQAWRWHNADVFTLNGVNWSLSCEAFFYLCFPILCAVLRRRSPAAQCGIAGAWFLACASVTLFGVLCGGGRELVTYVNPVVRSGEFGLGVVLGLNLGAVRAWAPPLWMSTGSLLGAATFVRLSVHRDHLPDVLLDPFFLLLLASAAREDFAERPGLLASRPLVYLGELSFAFYLVHELALRRLPVGDASARVAVGALVAFSAAVLLHHLVELPAQRYLGGLGTAHRRRGSQPSSPPQAILESIKGAKLRRWLTSPVLHAPRDVLDAVPVLSVDESTFRGAGQPGPVVIGIEKIGEKSDGSKLRVVNKQESTDDQAF